MNIGKIREDFLRKVTVTTLFDCKSRDIENLINVYYRNEKHIDSYSLPSHAYKMRFVIENDLLIENYRKNIAEVKKRMDNGDWNITATWILCSLCYDGIIPEGIYSFEESA